MHSFHSSRPVALLAAGLLATATLALTSCSDPAAPPSTRFTVTPTKPALLVEDHVSEGFLAPLSDGRVVLVFRLDPGVEGDHVGTGGKIASMIYDPHTDTWGPVETVYNSGQYDDRNIHGGLTRDGRIVFAFRHYAGGQTIERFFMYSDDDARSWQGPFNSAVWSPAGEPDTRLAVWGTGQLYFDGDTNQHVLLGYGGNATFATTSRDGATWDSFHLVNEGSPETRLTEIAGAWTGNNRHIALIRDNITQRGYGLLQTESHDNGRTWTTPVRTNMPPDQHWGAAPQLIYDEHRDLLIALTSDRFTRVNEENSIYIYTARPDEVHSNPESWTLAYERRRPLASETYAQQRPLNHRMYGYPTIAPINDREYLVVFSESVVMGGREQADLFYFRLVFE